MRTTTHIDVKSELPGYTISLTVPTVPRAMLHRLRGVFEALVEQYGYYRPDITGDYALAYHLYKSELVNQGIDEQTADDVLVFFLCYVVVSAHQHGEKVNEITIEEAISTGMVNAERVYGRLIFEIVIFAAWRI